MTKAAKGTSPLAVLISMSSIGLIVDDICSLPEKIINDFQIEIAKTKFYFPELEKFPEKNMYQVMAETKAHPKTSAPSPGDYLRAYKKALENYEKALVITLSSKLSATYASALQAKTLMPDPSKIVVFDSLSAAASEGILIIKAAQLIRQNKNLEEILETLTHLREKTKLFGFLETTYWVEKIGRMNSWQATVFKFLKSFGVLPMIGLKKGRIGLTGFNFWTKDVLKAVFHQIKFESKKHKILVGINYTDNIELAYKLRERVEKELKSEVAFTSLVPPIVGANSGPGTLIAGSLSL